MGGGGRFIEKEKAPYKTTKAQNPEENMNYFEGEWWRTDIIFQIIATKYFGLSSVINSKIWSRW